MKVSPMLFVIFWSVVRIRPWPIQMASPRHTLRSNLLKVKKAKIFEQTIKSAMKFWCAMRKNGVWKNEFWRLKKQQSWSILWWIVIRALASNQIRRFGPRQWEAVLPRPGRLLAARQFLRARRFESNRIWSVAVVSKNRKSGISQVQAARPAVH